jgi:hypothetical protein
LRNQYKERDEKSRSSKNPNDDFVGGIRAAGRTLVAAGADFFEKGVQIHVIVNGEEPAIRMGMSQEPSLLQFWTGLIQTLFSPCVLGHGHMLRTRDDGGHLALQCEDCGQTTRVLERQAIKGPKLHATPVKGEPLVTVRTVALRRSYPRSA